MLSKAEQHFYSRHILLTNVAESGQRKLKKSKVLVIGAGGLGCPVLMYLTGAGIGKIGIADGDTVSISNLHRQTLYGHEDVGLPKTKSAIKRLKGMNPYINFEGFSENLTADNVLNIVNAYDIIVDATDNFPARYLINDACVILNKPCVFASIDRFQGQLSVLNFNGGPTYRCIFPKPPKPETTPGCSEIGVLGVVTGILGSFQANEVIKIIIGIGDILSGRILMVDVLRNGFYTVNVKKNTKSADQVLDLKSGVYKDEYVRFCNSYQNEAVDISIEEIKQKIEKHENFQFVDIRLENRSDPIANSLNVPVSQIEQNLNIIDKNLPLILYCEKGIDSRKAVKEFRNHGIKNVLSLLGGLQAWKKHHM